jgi:hypothetical protein
MSDLLNSAGLVMIPSGYKEDVVYSAVPTDGSGDLSFTRASNGTRINSAGLVEVCPWNFVEQSNTFNTTWVSAGSGATITSGQTDPNSGSNAWLLSKLGQTGRIQQTVNVGGVQTFFIFAKKNTSDYILINVFDGTTSHECWFNLSTGVVGTQNSSTGTIESFGNGWFKCSVTSTNLVASGIIQIYQSDGNGNVTGTSGSIFIFNSQLNIGATAKPYFPTTDRLNVPRLTYQNGGGGCPSLLLEKQSTNLLSYSEDFDNAAWFKTETTVTANNTTSPDGTANADKLIPTTTNSTHYVDRSGIGVSSNGLASIFAKKGEYNRFAIRSYFTAGYAIFDVNSGVVVSTSSVTATIENVGNGWYRCSVNDTGNANYGYGIFVLQNTSTSVNAFSGNGTDGIFVWGAQLEASSYPTSYISTTSASATRVADACYKTGISSLIGQTEGTLFIDMVPTVVSGQGRYMNIYNASNTSNGWNAIISNGGTPNTFRFYGDGFDFSAGACLFGVRVKAALAYKNGVLTSAYVNGASVGTLTAVTTGKSYNTLELGSGPFGTDGSCNVNESIIFPTALTNAELASLTTL